MPRKPLTKWGNATFLSSSNQVVILSLVQFFFTLYINISFLLSHSINHTNQFLFPWKKNEETKQHPWLPPTFEKRMKKGNNKCDWRGGSGGYAWAGKNEVGDKKIVIFDKNILESLKIFAVTPFCHPKRVCQVGLLLWEVDRLKPKWKLF
jgi:hypothetical protein